MTPLLRDLGKALSFKKGSNLETQLETAFKTLASEKYELHLRVAVAIESILANLDADLTKDKMLARSWNERAQTAKANWNPTLAQECSVKERHYLKIIAEKEPRLLSQIELTSRLFANVHFSNVLEHQLLIIKELCSVLPVKSSTQKLLLQLTNKLFSTYKMPKSRFKLPLDFENKLEVLSSRISQLEQTVLNDAISIKESNPNIASMLAEMAQKHIEKTQEAISNVDRSAVVIQRKSHEDYIHAGSVERHMLVVEKKAMPILSRTLSLLEQLKSN